MECEEEELKAWQSKKASSLKPRCSQVEAQLDRVDAAVQSAEAKAKKREYVELDALKQGTATSLREVMSADSISSEDLFGRISGGSSTEIACDEFAKFVSSLETP